jgi:hypothetical protein
MSDTANDYIPGRGLFAEISELREQMTNLRDAMLQLVELQREANTKLLGTHPINGGDVKEQIQCANSI